MATAVAAEIKCAIRAEGDANGPCPAFTVAELESSDQVLHALHIAVDKTDTHQPGLASCCTVAVRCAGRSCRPGAAQGDFGITPETSVEGIFRYESHGHGSTARRKAGDRWSNLRQWTWRRTFYAVVTTQLFAVVLEPGHAVKAACVQAAEVFRRLLEPKVIRPFVARMDDAGLWLPVKAHRVAQAGGETFEVDFIRRFAQKQYAATPVPVRCAVQSAGLRDEDLTAAQGHAVGVVRQRDQYLGFRIGWRQPIDLARPGADEQVTVLGKGEHTGTVQ